MGPEAKIEAYLKKRVLETGGRIRKLKWIGQRGAPDRLVWWRCKCGHVVANPFMFFVEVKAAGKKATVQQKREHAKLRSDGFDVFVVDSLKAVDELITSHAYCYE
jgi:hypothetical protein